MTLNSRQQWFIWFCRRVLMMRQFKIYWPIGGSYWNEHHINKKDKSDLEQVIRDANDYTRHHVHQSFGLILMSIAIWVTTEISKGHIACFAVALFMECYAFAAHHYNRLLAQDQIQWLSLLEGVEEKKEHSQSFFFVSEHSFHLANGETHTFYSVVNRYDYKTMSPLFMMKKDAIGYQNYLMDRHKTAEDVAAFSLFCFSNADHAKDIYRRSCLEKLSDD